MEWVLEGHDVLGWANSLGFHEPPGRLVLLLFGVWQNLLLCPFQCSNFHACWNRTIQSARGSNNIESHIGGHCKALASDIGDSEHGRVG